MGLNRKNGTLKGVSANVYNGEEWEEQSVVGWRVGDGFLIGVEERDNGYLVELEISEKALRRMLDAIADAREHKGFEALITNTYSENPDGSWKITSTEVKDISKTFSEEPEKFDWIEGDFPT